MNDIKFNGNKLLRIRKGKNISQEKLAELVGVTRQTIYLWESNQNLPDVEKVSKLCEVLNVTLPDLVDGMSVQNTSEVNQKTENVFQKKKMNKQKMIKLLMIVLLVLVIIYLVMSMIKFFRLKDILSKWQKIDEADSYYYSYIKIDTDEDGLFVKESQCYEQYLKDGIMTTVFRNSATHDISFIMIDNYNTKERIIADVKNKTYKKEVLELETTALMSHLPNTLAFVDYNDIGVMIAASFNPKFHIKAKGSYTIEVDSLTTIINKDTGLIFHEEYFDKNPKTQNYVKEFSIDIDTDKEFEIDLNDYVEMK